VIIFSREVDLITPLCLQRLYAGCLDDCFRVTSGLLVVPRSNAAASSESLQQQQQQPSRLFVSRLEDPVFRCLSDLHMAAVPDTLRQVAHSLTSFEQHGRSAKSVAEMRSFVQNDLRDLTFKKRSLASHITLCEEVNKRFNGLKEFLHAEECMLIGADPTDASMRQSIGMRNYYADYFAECCAYGPTRVTRCASCACTRWLAAAFLLKTSRACAFCQAFGYQHVATFAALHKAGLLTPRDKVGHVASVTGGRQSALSSAAVPPSSASAAANASMDYPALRKRLQLVERAQRAQDSSRLSYAMSGLCEPLSGKR
uniref:Syntaxin binding protein n=1 Tax=Macrostomum lignano TaxID=282301 RepID=A0A1I8FSY3_9PLAT